MGCGWNLLFIDAVDLEEKSVESSEKTDVTLFPYSWFKVKASCFGPGTTRYSC
jgi:hypothetical protein